MLDLAKSADDPTEPDSHLDNTADDFTVDTFAESYGDPQPVGAVVKRKLGAVDDAASRSTAAPTQVVPDHGVRAAASATTRTPGVYYHRVRGFVSGTKPGDSVEVWFTAGGKESAHFTYTRGRRVRPSPVLLLANEDWSGVQPERRRR